MDVPWDLLDAASLRQKLLVNSEAFEHVKTLDPKKMFPHDVYNVLALLLRGQDSGVQLLEFSIEDIFNSDSVEQETIDPHISEQSDPITQPPKSPANRTAESLLLPSVSATVIDQLPRPLSESIPIAIENVADSEAGCFDTTGVNASNQHLKKVSQRSGSADTSKSNSKKRRREQIELEGGQTKKRGRKLVVPTVTREQSSRYTGGSQHFSFTNIFL